MTAAKSHTHAPAEKGRVKTKTSRRTRAARPHLLEAEKHAKLNDRLFADPSR